VPEATRVLYLAHALQDPTRVQPHLKKCFEGINTLDFDEDLVILAMNSVEKERVPLKVRACAQSVQSKQLKTDLLHMKAKD
jgi:hypothetical protein